MCDKNCDSDTCIPMGDVGKCGCSNDKCQCTKGVPVVPTLNLNRDDQEGGEMWNYISSLYLNLSDKDITKMCNKIRDSGFTSVSQLRAANPLLLSQLTNGKDGLPLGWVSVLSTNINNRKWQQRKSAIFNLFSVIYAGFCFSLLGLNRLIITIEVGNITDDGKERLLHVTEFTVPCAYSFILFAAVFEVPIREKRIDVRYVLDWVKIIALLLDCTAATVSALLIVWAQEDFERTAHFVSYSSFALNIIVDLMLLLVSEDRMWKRMIGFISLVIASGGVIAIIVLQYYDQDTTSHYVEFSSMLPLIVGSMIGVSTRRIR